MSDFFSHNILYIFILRPKVTELMVSTTETLPCLALQPYVRCYTLREFDTMGADFHKPLPANHEFSLGFTLSGSLFTYDTAFKKLKAGSKQHVIGLQTAPKGIVVFNGDIRFFSIQFRPDGFYKLFGIPSNKITDNIFEASDIICDGMETYNEQLNEAKNLIELKKLTDKFLLTYLLKRKTADPYFSISSTSSVIFKNNGNVNIKTLAYQANMSLRGFEKKFTEQVGLPPKLYARITRFNYVLMVKMRNMSNSWTDICHRCGYYDQMHFIKEFKEFAGDSPGNFYKTTPLPYEDYRKQ